MGKKERDEEAPDAKQIDVSKDASVDFPVEVESLEANPYHSTGEIFKAGSKNADKLIKRGWVKLVKTVSIVALFLLASVGAFAQASVIVPLYNATNTYSLAKLNAATITQDTVTNAGTGALYVKRVGGPGIVTIQVNITYVSGTLAGTVTLYGSLDGVNYSVINTQETQTALATKTLSGTASTSFNWRLNTSPYLYYQVGTAGATTVVYYINAWLLKH